MEITDVTATTHRVPVEPPLMDEVHETTFTHVEIETDEGITGYGITGSSWQHAIRSFINREAAPIVVGQDPMRVERIWDDLHRGLNQRDQTGVWSSGVSAIDIALWDIKGKYLDEPVWRLLGGANDPVQAYVTFGHHHYSKSELVEVAERLVDDGETRLKMIVGTGHGLETKDPVDIQRDAERVRAVREAVGDGVDLMVDANFTLAVDEALELSKRIEQYDIAFFEEPVYGNDTGLLVELKNRIGIPIAAGQNEGHRFRHRELIESGAVDICMPNVAYTGGYTEARKVAALAESFNLRLANGGGWPHHNVQLHAGVANGWLVEYHYTLWKAGEKIFEDPPTIDGGEVSPPDAPGVGLVPDHDALDGFRIE